MFCSDCQQRKLENDDDEDTQSDEEEDKSNKSSKSNEEDRKGTSTTAAAQQTTTSTKQSTGISKTSTQSNEVENKSDKSSKSTEEERKGTSTTAAAPETTTISQTKTTQQSSVASIPEQKQEEKPTLPGTATIPKDDPDVIVLDKNDPELKSLINAQLSGESLQIKRYKSRRNMKLYQKMDEIEVSICPTIPQGRLLHVLQCIEKHFDIDQKKGNLYSQFDTLDEAREVFRKQFGYASDNDRNILQFEFPDYMKRIVSESAKVGDENGFHVRWGSCVKAFNNEWLDDEFINFILDCFNLVMRKNTPTGVMPNFVFGNSSDSNQVLPQINQYPFLHGGIDIHPEMRNHDFHSNFSREMKHWFCSSSKGRLQKILDFSDASNTSLKNYGGIVNINNAHWIYIRFQNKYHSKKSNQQVPSILTFDSMTSGNGMAARSVRRWYSKFFGLYLKDSTMGQSINASDLNLYDLIAVEEFSVLNHASVTENASIVEVDDIPVHVRQSDGYNCGVFCLIKAWEDLLGIDYCETLEDDDETTKEEKMRNFCTQFRLSMCSLVYDLFEILHGNRVSPYSHVFAVTKKVEFRSLRSEDWLTWMKIIKLFEQGKFEIQDTEADENVKEDRNPNTIFNQLDKDDIDVYYKEVFGGENQTSKKSSPNKGQKKGSKRKQPLVTKAGKPRKKRKEFDWKRSTEVYIDHLPCIAEYGSGVPVKTTRSQSVINISNSFITLDAIDEKAKIEEAEFVEPNKVMNMVKEVLASRFRSTRLDPTITDEGRRKNRNKQFMERYMRKFDTYFLLDTDREDKKGINEGKKWKSDNQIVQMAQEET